MPAYQFIIFDWDGTLMDSIGRIVSSMKETAIALDFPVPSDQLARSVIGMSLEKALEVVFPDADEVQAKQLFQQYRKEYIELNTTPTPMFDGAEALLLSLKKSGNKLAVATGKARAGLDRVLVSTNLSELFVDTICADETESKPSPVMLQTICQRNGFDISDCVMIGDTIHDLAMAKAAGMDSIGVTFGVNNRQELEAYQPVAIVDDFEQLAEALN